MIVGLVVFIAHIIIRIHFPIADPNDPPRDANHNTVRWDVFVKHYRVDSNLRIFSDNTVAPNFSPMKNCHVIA